MIAIDVLRNAQQKVLAQTGKRPKIRCFFSKNDSKAFAQLTTVMARFNNRSRNPVLASRFRSLASARSRA
jgi:hypothetical protein